MTHTLDPRDANVPPRTDAAIPSPASGADRWKPHEKFWRATAEQLAAQEKGQFTDRRRVAGRMGERLAEDYFVKQLGAKLLARNFHVQYGEIDLLIEHDDDLVAVEVKTRDVSDMAAPEECVTWSQLRRIARALLTYAQDNDLLERSMRIDVIAIQTAPDGDVAAFTHLRSVYPG